MHCVLDFNDCDSMVSRWKDQIPITDHSGPENPVCEDHHFQCADDSSGVDELE